MFIRPKVRLAATLCTVLAFFAALLVPSRLLAETQDLGGEVINEQNQVIPGAVCTLNSRLLPQGGVSVTTGEKGRFDFPGLLYGTYSLSCAAMGYQPVFKGNISISAEQPPFMQMALPKEIVVHQKIEVRGQAGTVAQAPAAPPSEINSTQLERLPLVEQKFKAALPLVPGVIRTPNGKINIKGAGESQGLLLVNNAEMVDPVTGSFSIDIPFDAVESLDVYKSAYQAEYGRFSGGLTSVETKPPSNQFRFEFNDFLPTPRVKGGHIVGIADDEPRLYLTGPLIKDKLNFSEAFTYDLNKQPVRGLAYPHNEIKTEGFNSFTSFQWILASNQLLSAHVDAFPLRREFANINSFVPQTASSNYGQKGFSAGGSYRYLLSSGGILTTLFQFMKFDSNARGQGPQDMLVTPEGFGGNYFNSWTRQSSQEELLETYAFAPQRWLGHHHIKIGGNYLHRAYTGTSVSHPVLLQRLDGSVAEQIDFLGPASLASTDNELAFFLEDHWIFSKHLAVDAGLRFSAQDIGNPASFAPRFGLVYSPGQGGKTIFRGGVGVFYDRVPLLAGDFTSNPTRVVTQYDALGVPIGPSVVFQNSYVRVDEQGRHIVPTNKHLASTPYNITWNLEADREIIPHLLLRVSYLSSRTLDEFVINPLQTAGTPPSLLLSNTGGSRYHEFETTVRFRPGEYADLNFSYVHSLARGDLNTLATIYVPFEQPVIRPNLFGTLPANVPDRFITWGRLKLPWEMTASPVLDVHSGFPYSAVDVLQNYVGAPNSLRLPGFASLDLRLTKDFRVPLLPWVKNHKLRVGFAIFNVTNHSNPRDVYNSIASPHFGQFQGYQHRFYDASFDIVY
jgi:Carboxypeptidase regulatory-like domain/TonB dependent receptor-like, beta-barrel/TonB-dependent Receptor Plug Domain